MVDYKKLKELSEKTLENLLESYAKTDINYLLSTEFYPVKTLLKIIAYCDEKLKERPHV